MAEKAPLHDDLEGVPPGGAAYWVRAEDGTRLRIAIWRGGQRGTALLMPGRTEYIEKYGPVVARLQGLGFSVLVIDWRGQGLADRPFSGRSIGHVLDFSEYQQDLKAILALPEVEALPKPRVVFAHSMGGCIALRALNAGLAPVATIFSAPMWGLQFPSYISPFARSIALAGSAVGLGHQFAPGTSDATYVAHQGFDKNVLTNDAPTFQRLKDHAAARPELCLGGPSFGWLAAAFREMRALHMAKPYPGPVLTFYGEEEQIVSNAAIRDLCARLPDVDLVACKGAKHEIWMERDAIQTRVWQKIMRFLDKALAQAA